jgi:DNA polymerase-3 subunit epsilon
MMGLKLKRAWYRRKSGSPALARCWSGEYPPGGTDWRKLEFLVADTETSALSAAEGEMLSIGWVVMANAGIKLNTAEHYLLCSERGVGQSATIHQLRDCELVAGVSREAMMERFLQVARSRILVFHHAVLDMSFLNQISCQLYNAPLLLPFIDTLQMEQRRMSRQGSVPPKNGLRLGACRSRYSLPDYPGHNALIDALATAELLLAQLTHRSGTGKLSLRELIR